MSDIRPDAAELENRIGASLVRTATPYIVGYMASVLLSKGLNVDSELLTEIVGFLLGSAYYAGVRVLETRLSPLWGRLLGTASAPQYTK